MYFIVLCIAVLCSCKESDNLAVNEAFKVDVKVLDGWCAQDKNIVISPTFTQVKYQNKKNCKDNIGDKKSTKSATPPHKLERLKEILLDVNFKNSSISECAVCADGTDFIIVLPEDGKRYENRIAKMYREESELSHLQIKQQELLNLLDTFNEN